MFKFVDSINKKDLLQFLRQKTKADFEQLDKLIGQPVIVSKEILDKAVLLAKDVKKRIESISSPKEKNSLCNIEFTLLEGGKLFLDSVSAAKGYFGLFFLLSKFFDKNILWNKNAEKLFLEFFFQNQVFILIEENSVDPDLLLLEKEFFHSQNFNCQSGSIVDENFSGIVFARTFEMEKLKTKFIVPDFSDFKIFNNLGLVNLNAISFSDFYKRFERGEIDFSQWRLMPLFESEKNKPIEKAGLEKIKEVFLNNKEDFVAQKRAENVFENDGYKLKIMVQFVKDEPVLVYGKVYKEKKDENCGIVPFVLE